MKQLKFLFIITAMISLSANAQSTKDSAEVVKALKELLSICKNVDFGDPKTSSLGTFYKAATYIIYQGDDDKRRWKDFANYSNAEEKKRVDEVCYDINSTINQDSSYVITGFKTNKESEGMWYVLQVSYMKKDRKRNINFAFLKVKNRFGIGDID